MTDETTRPEPVLDEARLLRVFGMVLAAIVAVLGLTGVVVDTETVTRITATATVALSAGLAVWSYVGPMWRARRLREVVTPVADPCDADGTPLVPAGPAPAEPVQGSTVTLDVPAPTRFDTAEEQDAQPETTSLGAQWDALDQEGER